MDRLRSSGGCAWDARQTHESLAEYLLEETYETLAAIEHGTASDLVEELGDLLLQVVFHARLGQEESPSWDIDDVANGICEKLIRRHEHITFEVGGSPAVGGVDSLGPGDLNQVGANWTQAKALEKGRTSALDGIPRAMPALAQAQKTWRRAVESGVVLERPEPVPTPDSQHELGDMLLALVVVAEESGLDAEAALRGGIERTRQRIREAEEQAGPGMGD